MDLAIRLISLTITLTYYSVVRTSSPPAAVAVAEPESRTKMAYPLHPASASAAGRPPGGRSRATGQQVLTGDDRKQIEEIIDWTMRCRHIQGVAVSIVGRTEGVLMERGFGLANISTGSKVDEHTLFPIASTTKAFTSTLLALLIEKHKHLHSSFDWSTPIRKLLGDSFALYDNLLTSHVTLEDLLAHRTGIPDYFLLLLATYPERLTRKQLVQSLRYHKPEAPFRTHFLYNNHMYALAGYVAEVLEGRPWEDMVRSYLLGPLSMNSTLFVSEALRVRDKMAASYAYVDGKHRSVDIDCLHQVDVAGPAGAIVSTAHDMTKWMSFHLNGGSSTDPTGRAIVADTRRVTDTYAEQNVASVRQLNDRDLVRPMSPVSDIHVAYDLGWMTNYYRGYKRVWHSGSISAYKSQLWLYPDKDFGIFIAANSLSSGATQGLSQIMYFISDLLLGERPWFNVSSIRSECSATDPVDDTDLPTDPRPRPHPDFLGVYANAAFGNVTVSYEVARNALRLSMGRFLTADLHYNRSDDTFYGAHDGVIWFRRERIPVRFRSSLSGGDVDVLEMPLSGPKETKHMASFVKVNGKPAHGHAHGQSTVNAVDTDGCVCVRSSAVGAASVEGGMRRHGVELAMLVGYLLLCTYTRVGANVLPGIGRND